MQIQTEREIAISDANWQKFLHVGAKHGIAYTVLRRTKASTVVLMNLDDYLMYARLARGRRPEQHS